MIDGLIGLSVVTLTGIGCLHVYWAFGGTWGSTIVLPTTKTQNHTFVPGKIATLIVAFLVFFAALLLFLQGGLFVAIQPNFIVKWGCWVCVTAFGLRVVGDFKYFGLFKKVRNSRFSHYDTYLFTPLCVWFSLIFYAAITIGS
ncbi:hypothetical protein J2T13_002256 [Paenibacillus sp. DS2015]|uniref:DUF3995 domain-containing protein n=1 Tax=Paenibacillus sp. DS2015 TaxID=3373917 RepID=UPI003D1BB586